MSGEQTSDRAAIAAETWADAETSPPAKEEAATPVETSTEAVVEPTPEVDPWAGVPAALRDEVEGLRNKVKSIDEMGFRLKQTESRLGGVLNDLHAAKEAAKTVKSAPTQQQIDQAASNQGAWDALKSDFPEWTLATEGRIAAERAEMSKEVQAIREEMKTASAAEMEKLTIKFGETVVSLKHPDWKTVKETDEFKKWHATTGNRDSFEPLEVAAIFDEFAAYKATHKSAATIQAERKQRLELSQSTPGHRLAPVKSDADLSASELRASIAKQTWG